jgi:hypothetical protein
MGTTKGFKGEPANSAQVQEQAVLIHLNGISLPEEIYEEFDLATLEDLLSEAIDQGKVGEYDGNEIDSTGATLYMYGPNAERLLAVIEPTLKAYPLCQGAEIVVRYGGPGAMTRKFRLPTQPG